MKLIKVLIIEMRMIKKKKRSKNCQWTNQPAPTSYSFNRTLTLEKKNWIKKYYNIQRNKEWIKIEERRWDPAVLSLDHGAAELNYINIIQFTRVNAKEN